MFMGGGHVFIYGRPMMFEAHHKTLISVAKRDLVIVRFFYQLQIYDFQIEKKPERTDLLSGIFANSAVEEIPAPNYTHVNLI